MSFFSHMFRRSSDAIKDLASMRGFTLLDRDPAELEKLKKLLQFPPHSPQEKKLNIRAAAMHELTGMTLYAALVTSAARVITYEGGRHTTRQSTHYFMIRILKPNHLKSVFSIRKKLPGFIEGMVGTIINKVISSEGAKTVVDVMNPEFQNNFTAYTASDSTVLLPAGVQQTLALNAKKFPFTSHSWSLDLSNDGLLLIFPPTTSTEQLISTIDITREITNAL